MNNKEIIAALMVVVIVVGGGYLFYQWSASALPYVPQPYNVTVYTVTVMRSDGVNQTLVSNRGLYGRFSYSDQTLLQIIERGSGTTIAEFRGAKGWWSGTITRLVKP